MYIGQLGNQQLVRLKLAVNSKREVFFSKKMSIEEDFSFPTPPLLPAPAAPTLSVDPDMYNKQGRSFNKSSRQ